MTTTATEKLANRSSLKLGLLIGGILVLLLGIVLAQNHADAPTDGRRTPSANATLKDLWPR
jgi:hypothetical protein